MSKATLRRIHCDRTKRYETSISHYGAKFKAFLPQIELSDGGHFRRIVVIVCIFVVSLFARLRRLLKVGREVNNSAALLWWNPFHFLFKSRRNVKLNHLCHKPSDFPKIAPSGRCTLFANVSMETGKSAYSTMRRVLGLHDIQGSYMEARSLGPLRAFTCSV